MKEERCARHHVRQSYGGHASIRYILSTCGWSLDVHLIPLSTLHSLVDSSPGIGLDSHIRLPRGASGGALRRWSAGEAQRPPTTDARVPARHAAPRSQGVPKGARSAGSRGASPALHSRAESEKGTGGPSAPQTTRAAERWLPSFRGRPKAGTRNPFWRLRWIPGSPLTRRPGMTVEALRDRLHFRYKTGGPI